MTTIRLFDGFQHTAPGLRQDVKDAQRLLTAAGFDVVADGYFGRLTQDAVIAFQKRNGLDADGVIGAMTWAALQGEKPKPGQLETTYSKHHGALERDSRFANEYRNAIEAAAIMVGVPIAVIVGIGSRESSWGASLWMDGTGDRAPRPTPRPWRAGSMPPDGGGFGRGLMQIDYDAHEFARTGDWRNPEANIEYGAKVLRDGMRYLANQAGDHLLHAGLAAYNCGAGNVAKSIARGRDIDYYTTKRDYGRDVLNRAGWFQQYGGW